LGREDAINGRLLASRRQRDSVCWCRPMSTAS
jgi:hypothetical protein